MEVVAAGQDMGYTDIVARLNRSSDRNTNPVGGLWRVRRLLIHRCWSLADRRARYVGSTIQHPGSITDGIDSIANVDLDAIRS
jgi:hypothetical protein